jgi:hypothetical protein
MFKAIMLTMLLIEVLSAQSMHFIEEKYHAALDRTLNKKGNITFEKGKISIVYKGSGNRLLYDDNYLYTTKNKKVHKLDLRKKPAIKMFFVLFEAVYLNKQNVLKSYFNITKKGNTFILHPKKSIAPYIKAMQYSKVKNKLLFLTISLGNGDRIHIEEIS